MWRKCHHTSYNCPPSCRAVGMASPITSEGEWRVGPCSGITLSIFHFLSGNNWQRWDDFPGTLEGQLQGSRVTYVPFKGKKSTVFPCPDPRTITYDKGTLSFQELSIWHHAEELSGMICAAGSATKTQWIRPILVSLSATSACSGLPYSLDQ